jgi:hypothetical protein
MRIYFDRKGFRYRSAAALSMSFLPNGHPLAQNIPHEWSRQGHKTLKIGFSINFKRDQSMGPIEDFHGGLVKRIDQGTLFLTDHNQEVIVGVRLVIPPSAGTKQDDFLNSIPDSCDAAQELPDDGVFPNGPIIHIRIVSRAASRIKPTVGSGCLGEFAERLHSIEGLGGSCKTPDFKVIKEVKKRVAAIPNDAEHGELGGKRIRLPAFGFYKMRRA